MRIFSSIALLAVLQLSTAAPAPQSMNIVKRKDSIDACKGKSCGDCPLALATGEGYPHCRVYETSVLEEHGFSVAENGQTKIFLDIPPQGDGYSVIVQTAVTYSGEGCGGNVLIAPDATCAPIKVDSAFMLQFCCGPGDCGAAGAPSLRRSPKPAGAFGGGGSSGSLVMHDRNGKVIEPKPLEETHAAKANSESKRAAFEGKVQKLCEEFTATSEPYTEAGDHTIISDVVTCPPTQECEATEGESVTESFHVEGSIEVGDPLDIVSGSNNVGWEESSTREFSSSYTFGAGERGYVIFIPILTCIDGYFCDSDYKTVCSPTNSGGAMSGDRRGVVIRG